jgi:hypothetical protein
LENLISEAAEFAASLHGDNVQEIRSLLEHAATLTAQTNIEFWDTSATVDESPLWSEMESETTS